MKAENRRKERRSDIIEKLKQGYSELIDMTHLEKEGKYLEGTGSLVIDHDKKIAFAAISQRTHIDALNEWKKHTGYEVVTFNAHDKNKETVYHTNVVLSLGEKYAVICEEAINSTVEKKEVLKKISENREIIFITIEQMHSFCANILEVKNEAGRKFTLMSAQAYNEFSEKQKSIFIKYTTIIYSLLNTIETIGGGSARCMIAELF